MVLFNYSTRELTAKIVYYGPGLCGKTTNLQYIFDNLPGSVKGKMLSLATKTDRTLFFDFLPLDLGEIRGMKTRIQLYTVPGQVFYNETRRLVLKGADGVVFVADSQKQMMEADTDSYRNLEENLRVHSMKLAEMPLVVQYNKRDLPNLASIEELNQAINRYNSPFYESVATTGIGVQDTLKAITKLVLLHLTKRYDAKKPAEVASAVAGGSAVAAGSAGSSPRPAAGIPSPPSYASGRSTSASSSQETVRASAAATTFEESTETPLEDIVELTEEIEEETAAFDEEEPIELVDEVDEMEETIAITSFSSSPPLARAGTVEKEFEIDEDAETEDASVEASKEGPAAERRASATATPTLTPGGAAIEISLEKETPPLETARADRPGLDVVSSPRLSLGEQRTILVPLELELGGTRRRFTLSIALRISDLSDTP